MESPCRRCGECADSDHHWQDNPDFGADPLDAEEPIDVHYVCKHCVAVGEDCPECDGSGVIGDPEAVDAWLEANDEWDERFVCPRCDGAGIVEVVTREGGAP